MGGFLNVLNSWLAPLSITVHHFFDICGSAHMFLSAAYQVPRLSWSLHAAEAKLHPGKNDSHHLKSALSLLRMFMQLADKGTSKLEGSSCTSQTWKWQARLSQFRRLHGSCQIRAATCHKCQHTLTERMDWFMIAFLASCVATSRRLCRASAGPGPIIQRQPVIWWAQFIDPTCWGSALCILADHLRGSGPTC